MLELTEALRALQVWVFCAVAVVAIVQLLRHRSRPGAWAAATFSILGGFLLARSVLPDDSAEWPLVGQQLLIAVLVLFPYCLFRFGTSFRPAKPAVQAMAAAITAAAAGAIFLFRDVPDDGEPRTAAFTAYSFLVLVEWAALSTFVAVTLWTAGKDRPTVIRRRMRTLAVGALGIVFALMLAVVAPDSDGGSVADLVRALFAVASGPVFVAGLAPPQALLGSWRRREVKALYEAEAALMAATNRTEVAAALLPHVTQAMGGSSAVLTDATGSVVGTYGATRAGADGASAMSVPLRGGRLSIAGDAYTPFFGRNEAVLLERMARLTDVALRRAEVTDRERDAAAELEAANEAMRSFVAIASHDLRTPIAAIRGFAELLDSQWAAIEEDQKRGYVATIARQAEHVSRIVSDLLTMSQLDSGSVTVYSEQIALAAVVKEVVADLGLGGVTVDLDDDIVVCSDPDHLERIIRNLLENASHYGAPPIEVTAIRSGGAVELRVRDHGDGVAEEFEERLFERFSRSDRTKRRAKHGTGLGLAIVQGLARAAGGDAWFERTHPGACFAVRLPAWQD